MSAEFQGDLAVWCFSFRPHTPKMLFEVLGNIISWESGASLNGIAAGGPRSSSMCCPSAQFFEVSEHPVLDPFLLSRLRPSQGPASGPDLLSRSRFLVGYKPSSLARIL